jgi:SAM-dependent methyltransferase
MGNRFNGDIIATVKHNVISLGELSKELFRSSTKHILVKSSKLAREVDEYNSGDWRVLRTIYDNNPEGILEWLVYPFTLGLEGARDTRSRLNMYIDLISNVLENGDISGNGEPSKYLDLACGCSYGPIRAAKKMLEQTENPNFRIKGSDIREDAVEYSRRKAMEEGVFHLMDFDAYSINRLCENEPLEGYDGVGTHGYADYKAPRQAIILGKKIRDVMKPGATLIMTNMKKKDGFDLTRIMMESLGYWFVKKKTEEQLGNILYDAGFENINIQETPLGHHYIATAKKSG